MTQGRHHDRGPRKPDEIPLSPSAQSRLAAGGGDVSGGSRSARWFSGRLGCPLVVSPGVTTLRAADSGRSRAGPGRAAGGGGNAADSGSTGPDSVDTGSGLVGLWRRNAGAGDVTGVGDSGGSGLGGSGGGGTACSGNGRTEARAG